MRAPKPPLLAGAFLLAASTAFAQTPAPPSPIARADVTGTLGWFNAEKAEIHSLPYSNDWYSRSLHGSLGAGWYWTDNLKTEIDVAATTKAEMYASRQLVVDGRQTYSSSEFSFDTRKLAVSQQYQFYRNVFFHPHLAAGVDLTWERVSERVAPTFTYDPVARTSTQTSPSRTVGPETSFRARPFAAVGFKAYMTPRSFFRSDMRWTFHGGIDEVLLRFGFGVDF